MTQDKTHSLKRCAEKMEQIGVSEEMRRKVHDRFVASRFSKFDTAGLFGWILQSKDYC